MLKKLTCAISLLIPIMGCASSGLNKLLHQHFYVGGIGGYGSTTWSGLVPSAEKQNLALSVSTPIQTEEGGSTWGVMTGFEFTKSFALEGSYMRYRAASVIFDSMSIFSFDNNEQTYFSSYTETLSLMGKIMLSVQNTKLRFFSSAGVANVHRKDMLLEQWHLGPTFGLGANYQMTEHLMGELGGNYTAGYGESQLNPTETYIPFLYSATFRIAYLF